MFLLVGSLWFLSSALLSTYANTTFLMYFKDPVLHTLIRFAGSAALGSLTLIVSGDIHVNEALSVSVNVAQPAVLLWLANYANSIALQEAGITLTYVLKAGIPVFTVLVCAASGQKIPVVIYLSLLPICLGVGLACMGDLNFTVIGFTAALTSALAQTFMNISIKSVRTKMGYSGMKSFWGMSIVCTIVTFVVMLTGGIAATGQGESSTFNTFEKVTAAYTALLNGDNWPVVLIFIAALAYYIEYALNFVFVGFVSSVAFSVSDIARRVAIISIGSVVFNKQLTVMNWVGIAVALGGVLWYTHLENERAVADAVKKNDGAKSM